MIVDFRISERDIEHLTSNIYIKNLKSCNLQS
jgi:hypothetical protein